MWELSFSYVGDCEIHMDISKFNLGVKGVQVSAVLLMLPFQVPVVHLCLLIKKPEAS